MIQRGNANGLTSDGSGDRTRSQAVRLVNDGTVDAFGRIRVAEPYTLFDSQLTADKQPLLWDEVLTTGGTATHLPAEASSQTA